MFNKAIPVPFMLEEYSILFPACYTPRFTIIAFMIIIMMMIGMSGYQLVSEYLNNQTDQYQNAQYRLQFNTKLIISGTLVFD